LDFGLTRVPKQTRQLIAGNKTKGVNGTTPNVTDPSQRAFRPPDVEFAEGMGRQS